MSKADPVKLTPEKKPCFLCDHEFLAEWARNGIVPLWHVSEICPSCEQALRGRAA